MTKEEGVVLCGRDSFSSRRHDGRDFERSFKRRLSSSESTSEQSSTPYQQRQP